jgi:hypothetical protein
VITGMASAHKQRSGLIALLVASLVYGWSASGQAQEPNEPDDQARCLVLGPLVMSGYIAFLEQVSAGDRAAAAERAGHAADLVELYHQLGCPMSSLTEAVECLSTALIARSVDEPIGTIAQTCMEDAGLPVR